MGGTPCSATSRLSNLLSLFCSLNIINGIKINICLRSPADIGHTPNNWVIKCTIHDRLRQFARSISVNGPRSKWKYLEANNNSLPIQSHALNFGAQHRWSLDLFWASLGWPIRHFWLFRQTAFIIVYLWQHRQLSLPLFTASPTFHSQLANLSMIKLLMHSQMVEVEKKERDSLIHTLLPIGRN